MRRARAGNRARAASEQISTPSSPVVARARMCGERHARRVHFTRSTSRRLVGKVVSSKVSGFRKNRTDSGSRVPRGDEPAGEQVLLVLAFLLGALLRFASLALGLRRREEFAEINRDVSEVSIAAFRRRAVRYRYRSRKRRNRDDPTRVHRRRPRWQPSSARSLWQLTTFARIIAFDRTSSASKMRPIATRVDALEYRCGSEHSAHRRGETSVEK